MSAAVIYVVFAVWPVIAFAGGLAFAPLAGLAAISTVGVSAPRVRLRLYMLALLAFFAYAAASLLWSPRPLALVTGDFATKSFAVRSEILRVGLALVAGACLIIVAQRLNDRQREVLQRVVTIALMVQLIVVAALTLFERQAIAFFYGAGPDDEGVQNISRNSQILVVAAPFLYLGLSRGRSRALQWVIAALVIAATGALVFVRGVDMGLLALGLAGVFMLCVTLFKQSGWRLIGGLIATLIMTAPWSGQLLSHGANAVTATNSIEYRQAIWQRVLEIIDRSPLMGSGVGVLRTQREMIPEGVFANLYYIPNHAHNMLLQLWAETGAIGAGLLSLAVLLAAFRLPRPQALGRTALLVAGLIGGMMAAWISFDLWNEWWWTVGILLAVLAVASPRPGPDVNRQGRAARTITFGVDDPPPTHSQDADAGKSAAVGGQVLNDADAAPRAETSNNFNLVRLVLAAMVVAYHLVILSRGPSYPGLDALSLMAELGVQGFFVVSGYLVWMSLERSASLRLYGEKRVRRLVPAYVVVVAGCALAAVILSVEARNQLGAVGAYLGWNLAFLNFMQPVLPGLFAQNPFPEVNGALWTLKIEVMFYLVLPCLAWFIRRAGRGRWVLFLLIYVAAEVWREYFAKYAGGGAFVELSRQLPGQMSFFVTGIALACWRATISWRSLLPVLGLCLTAVSIALPAAEPLRAAGWGIVVIWLAIGIIRLPDAARFGDLSYGLYIVHFPIIQAVIALGLFAASWWTGAAIAAGASLVAALLLWHLIEKPALRRDSAYRQ